MDERMNFQANKENLEGLVNRFRTDFSSDDLELLEYFAKSARENVLATERLNRLKTYLEKVYFYKDDIDPIEEAIKLLEYKTNNEKGYLNHFNKIKYPKPIEWKRIVALKNRINESISVDESMNIKTISDELNEILEGSE